MSLTMKEKQVVTKQLAPEHKTGGQQKNGEDPQYFSPVS